MFTVPGAILFMICGTALIAAIIWGACALGRLAERTASKPLQVAIVLFIFACYFGARYAHLIERSL